MLMMRTRRIENERLLLEELQQRNSTRMLHSRDGEAFMIEIDGFPALRCAPDGDEITSQIISDSHALRVVFPRYYPAMPVEVYLDAPVFHPNVNPENGFICLWARHRVQITLEQTLAQLQRVLAWALLNTSTEHLMQPDALRWHEQLGAQKHLPLRFVPLTPVYAQAWDYGVKPLRRRLS